MDVMQHISDWLAHKIEGRLIDIPYRTSPPLLMVFQQTASLLAGGYAFPAGTKTVFSPERPIRPNSLYLFQTMDFAVDIAEGDYLAAVTAAMNFSMYVQGDAAPALREPVPLVKYLDKIPYALNILGTELLGDSYPGSANVAQTQGFTFNRLLGNITGTLTQTAALLGKASVTATMLFSVQEVTDRLFIQDFVQRGQRSRAPRQSQPQDMFK
jgi:hypothetical protein